MTSLHSCVRYKSQLHVWHRDFTKCADCVRGRDTRTICGRAPGQARARQTPASSSMKDLGPETSELEGRLRSAGQSHLWDHYEALRGPTKLAFKADLESVDWARLRERFQDSMAAMATADNDNADVILPFTNVQTLEEATVEDRKRWRAAGLAVLAQGRVGALMLAGGQGTRLGSTAPKGCYDIGLPSRKSLFQLHAERLQALERLAAAEHAATGASPGAASPAPIPWWILTSDATDAETRAFFASHSFFGLRPTQVTFVRQGALPALDERGAALLGPDNQLSLSPDGNGGVYEALRREGVLTRMAELGIEALDCWPVDNALAKPLAPEWVGRCLDAGADLGCRVVAKAAAEEKVGVLALRGGHGAEAGRLGIVEYGELSAARAAAIDPDTGRLLFNWANVCLHFFSRPFLETACAAIAGETGAPPYHVARKAVPTLGGGKTPGIKLELFIFDVFGLATRPFAAEVDRAAEFAPVKNAAGYGVDCPETARAAVLRLHGGWVEAAGGTVDWTQGGVEVSPLVSLEGEGLAERCRGGVFTSAYDTRLQDWG